jgi:hypothetical protein
METTVVGSFKKCPQQKYYTLLRTLCVVPTICKGGLLYSSATTEVFGIVPFFPPSFTRSFNLLNLTLCLKAHGLKISEANNLFAELP